MSIYFWKIYYSTVFIYIQLNSIINDINTVIIHGIVTLYCFEIVFQHRNEGMIGDSEKN